MNIGIIIFIFILFCIFPSLTIFGTIVAFFTIKSYYIIVPGVIITFLIDLYYIGFIARKINGKHNPQREAEIYKEYQDNLASPLWTSIFNNRNK